MRSGWANANGLSTTALTTVKIAVVAPTPNASVTAATNEKSGRLAKLSQRKANVLRDGTHPLAFLGASHLSHLDRIAIVAKVIHIAESPQRLGVRIVGRHASRRESSHAHLDVKAYLVVEFAQQAFARRRQSQGAANAVGYLRVRRAVHVASRMRPTADA